MTSYKAAVAQAASFPRDSRASAGKAARLTVDDGAKRAVAPLSANG